MKHEDYLKGVNLTWRKDDRSSELDHCRLAIIEEVGEIAGWYKKIHGYKRKKDEEWKIEVKGEMGDLLYYLTKLFNLVDEDEMIEADFELPMEHKKVKELEHIPDMVMMAAQLSLYSENSAMFLNNLEGLFDYLRLLINHEGFDFDDVALSNLAKLQKRHGSNFNEKATTEKGRNRDEESNALKNGQ